MAFFDNLGSILDQQFNLSDNKLRSLDTTNDDGSTQRFGALGDFAGKFDQSAERRYLENGFTKHSRLPKQLEIMSQEPEITVLVKKREFSSLRVQTNTELMDKHDKLFLKASAILFNNKCNQLSAYEKLSKIERIAQIQNNVEYAMLPILVDAADVVDLFSPSILSPNKQPSSLKKAIEKIRKLVAFNRTSATTQWVVNRNSSFKTTYGIGTGVIELTTVNQLDTTTSIKWGTGSCSLSLSNPLEILVITDEDIDRAISDSLNPFYSSTFFQLSKSALDSTMALTKRLLNLKRKNRGVNPIKFIVQPDTFLGKKVRVLIDGLGIEINLDTDPGNRNFGEAIIGDVTNIDTAADFGGPLGNQGLKGQEKDLIKSIANSIFAQLSTEANTERKLRSFNKDNTLLRKQMRLHYNQKSIIQPLDEIHVYINSKSQLDTKILSGLQTSFNSFGFQQKVSQGLNGLKDSLNSLFKPDAGFSKIEKDVFVGSDFPNYLWSMLRHHFVTDKAGTHVFAGLVKSAPQSYGSGAFTLSVVAEDMTAYFKQGKVNFTPSATDFDHQIYDPVTPFDTTFDSITGKAGGKGGGVPKLLPQNIDFITKNNPKFDSGPDKGKEVTLTNFFNKDMKADPVSKLINQIYYAPSGMVYRWKSGIATLTQTKNTFNPSASIVETVITRTTSDAFAGQDVMNVLSLLLTGEPYNFATFYKNAIQFDSYKTEQTVDASYYRGLLNNLKKNNRLYGNYIPFKRLSIPESQTALAIRTQTDLLNDSSQLESLLRERAILFDRLSMVTSGGVSSGQDGTAQQDSTVVFKVRIKELDEQIGEKQNAVNQAMNSGEKFLSIQGDDISFEVGGLMDTGKSTLTEQSRLRKELRRKLNYLTRRLMYRVKSNDDSNLLIVDDSYDKDYDFQAFSKSVTGNMNDFSSDYSYVGEQINNVAGILDLEVFCDSQGHIQIRPPQYNRVPQSVFYKMFQMKEQLGIQLFPSFLEDLFKNQVKSLVENIEVVEDEIRYYALALGKASDDEVTALINIGGGTFTFVSAQDGKIASLEAIFNEKDPDDKTKVSDSSELVRNLGDLSSSLERQAKNTGSVFNIQKRVSLVSQTSVSNINTFITSSDKLQDRSDAIVNRLTSKTGVAPVQLKSLLVNTDKLKTTSAIDVFKITKEIAGLIGRRQNLVKSAASAVKSMKDTYETTTSGGESNKVTFQNLFTKKDVPEILENMIEDESYDDYGFGSGSRYVIRNRNIISYDFNEKPPGFNMVRVDGLFAEGFADAPGDLSLSKSGGNALTSAYAVDYDLWRMYGLKDTQAVTVPFFSDPDTQCAPYAVSLLNRERGKIFTGTAALVGNEFQQPGEVVYFEPRNILFYVQSVSHNFTYGNVFKTTINMSHGHGLGEYIPTSFDVIGKVLYRNRDQVNQTVYKGPDSGDQKLGTIILAPVGGSVLKSAASGAAGASGATGESGGDQIAADPYGSKNKNILLNIGRSIFSFMTPNSDKVLPTVQIRIFFNSKKGINTVTPELKEAAEFVKKFLTAENSKKATAAFGSSDPPAPALADDSVFLPLPKELVTIEEIDRGKESEPRQPSSFAWDAVNNLNNNSSASSGASSDGIKREKILASSVIDIWLVSE